MFAFIRMRGRLRARFWFLFGRFARAAVPGPLVPLARLSFADRAAGRGLRLMAPLPVLLRRFHGLLAESRLLVDRLVLLMMRERRELGRPRQRSLNIDRFVTQAIHPIPNEIGVAAGRVSDI